MAEVTNFS